MHRSSCATLLLLLAACGESTLTDTVAPAGGIADAASVVTLQLEQCANGAGSGGCTWQTGDLNAKNAAYAEGDVVPFRLAMEGLTPGMTYTVTLGYDFTAEGHQAYDFLTSYDATETAEFCAMSGKSTPAICAGSPGFAATLPFPLDPNPSADTDGGLAPAGSQTPGAAFFYGAFPASVSPYTRGGDTGGESTARITFTFTATQGSALLLWGGHLASGSYWTEGGEPDGAGAIADKPWRMEIAGFSAKGAAGARSNVKAAIQPSAVN